MPNRATSCAAIAGALAVIAIAPTGASAGSAQGVPPSTSGGAQGKGATTDKFRANYVDGALGVPVSCTGVRVVNRGAGTKDSETCLVSVAGGIIPGTYPLDSNGIFQEPWNSDPNTYWTSDYDRRLARSGTITFTLNGDGTATEIIDVTY